jgi:arsenate reductase-like glutaredoxin family protein
MFKKNIIKYATAILLGVLIFASDFLDTNIFNFDEKNFAVWFVLSILCFASGWYINKTLGWHKGGKIVFSVIIAVTIVSIFMITFFSGYFNANEILTENLILYSLRNITLGAMGFFGMAIQEVINNRKDTQILTEKVELLDRESDISKKEVQLIIKEANLNAEKIINDAEAKAKNLILKKERIEKELKEFIQTERELIKRYEEK